MVAGLAVRVDLYKKSTTRRHFQTQMPKQAPLTPTRSNIKNSKTITPKTFKRLKTAINDSVSNKHAHEGSCWLPKQKPNGRGHSQIKFESVKYLMHRVNASKGDVYIEYDKDEKNDASHLCGYHDCINPDHLHLESADYNQTRDCCHRLGKFKPRYLCPHFPHCIYLANFTQ